MIEMKQCPMRPDIRAVVGHENRQVTEQQQTFFLGQTMNRFPLSIKEKLRHPGPGNRGFEFGARLIEEIGITIPQGNRPGMPGRAFPCLERLVQAKIVEPVGLGGTEYLELRTHAGIRVEGATDLFPLRPSQFAGHIIGAIESRQARGINQPFIARKDGTGLIGTAQAVRWTQGQRLPNRKTRLSQVIDPSLGHRPQSAHSARSGKRGRMQQHPRTPLGQQGVNRVGLSRHVPPRIAEPVPSVDPWANGRVN
jgi:hypothetical protein